MAELKIVSALRAHQVFGVTQVDLCLGGGRPDPAWRTHIGSSLRKPPSGVQQAQLVDDDAGRLSIRVTFNGRPSEAAVRVGLDWVRESIEEANRSGATVAPEDNELDEVIRKWLCGNA